MDDETLPHASGSETSQAAAEAAGLGARSMARRVFDVIARAGARGMTVDELDAMFEPLGHRHQTISARVHGLAERNMLISGPDQRRTRKHCWATVWRATEAALQDFDALYSAPVQRTHRQAAGQDLVRLTKRIAKQAMTGDPALPSIGEAERLVVDGLLTLYAAIYLD